MSSSPAAASPPSLSSLPIPTACRRSYSPAPCAAAPSSASPPARSTSPRSCRRSLARLPKSLVLSLNHSVSIANQMAPCAAFIFLIPPIAKVLLVESYDRDLVSQRLPLRRPRHLLHLRRALPPALPVHPAGSRRSNLGQHRADDFLLDLVSEVPSLRVLNSVGDQLLTPREEQVVALVAEGLSNRDIARELNLSEHTIKKYLVPHLRQAGDFVPGRTRALRRQPRRPPAGGMARRSNPRHTGFLTVFSEDGILKCSCRDGRIRPSSRAKRDAAPPNGRSPDGVKSTRVEQPQAASKAPEQARRQPRG